MLLGAHISTSGGLANAPARAREIGGQSMQIFTGNQRTWLGRVISKDEARDFCKAREEQEIAFVASHASYLINAASPDRENLKKSRELLAIEIGRCLALGIDALVLHPGAAKESPREIARSTVAKSLNPLLDQAAKGGLKIALENTVGAGTTLGADFAELGDLLERMAHHDALGVCLDTAHAWGAGYDLTGNNIKTVLAELTAAVGEGRLICMHLNDAKVELGSKKDRHETIGEGTIGLAPFRKLQGLKKLAPIAGILETPGGMESWGEEIRRIAE